MGGWGPDRWKAAALAAVAVLSSVWPTEARSATALADFRHVRWDMAAGAPSRINAITQSSDGYLWIGGVEGLVRFDGVAFETISSRDPRLRRIVVSALATGRSGDVWVGLARSGGVAVYRNGRLIDAGMPNASREVNEIAVDHQGGVWVARGGRSSDTLALYANGRWREFGISDGLPEQNVWQVLPTRDGAVWVVLTDTVVVRAKGEQQFKPTGLKTTPRGYLAEDGRGRLWLSDLAGVRQVAGPRGSIVAYARPSHVGRARLLVDRSGSLWGAAWNEGLFRLPAPGQPEALEKYGAIDGLTSDQARTVFQDREGSVWVGTELGLDMFRPARVIVEAGIPANSPTSYRIASASDGVVYVGDASDIYAIPPGGAPRKVLHAGTPIEALCAGNGGRIWAILGDRTVSLSSGKTSALSKPADALVQSCTEDAAGRLWAPALGGGLHVLQDRTWRRWADGAALPSATAISPSGQAAVVFRLKPSEAAAVPYLAVFGERFEVGGVEGIFPGVGALFVGGADGLVKVVDRRAQTLPARTYPWLASINGGVQAPSGDTWLIGDAGILRVNSKDLDRAFAIGGPLPHQLFDFRDGLNSFVQKAAGEQAAVGGDGRVWLLTRRNVVRIDPANLAPNTVPPPVQVRAIETGGRKYSRTGQVKLPAGTTNITVDYTALSLAEPTRVRFRYRLEGIDKAWIEAGSRRSALYVNLHPGKYRFKVIAANNDGVWNLTGDTVELSIRPTLLQSWWFRCILAIAALIALWIAVRWRIVSATVAAESRLSALQAERDRIARELHDTLLQGFQGLLVRFQVVANAIPQRSSAKGMMEAVLDRAEEVLVEGRERVSNLRANEDGGSPLTLELERLAFELERDHGTPIDVRASGAEVPLSSDVRREIFAIAREALVNAVRHAHATAIVCELLFKRQQLVVECRDNGIGVPKEVLRRGGRDGHWGLRGMQERARQIGGVLQIDSQPTGVAVRFSIRMDLARPRRARSWRLS